jgi:hypothetical protein
VRGVIRVLEEIGFRARAVVTGSRYTAIEDGLRPKPILFMFGSDFALALFTANRRAVKACDRHSGEWREFCRNRPSALCGLLCGFAA